MKRLYDCEVVATKNKETILVQYNMTEQEATEFCEKRNWLYYGYKLSIRKVYL